MSEVVFITLGPDSYDNNPQIRTVCPPRKFPKIPERKDIFEEFFGSEYKGSGYDPEDKSEEIEFFNLYGDREIYYAIYFLILEDESVLGDINRYLRFDSSWESPDKFVESCKKIRGVIEAIAITNED